MATKWERIAKGVAVGRPYLDRENSRVRFDYVIRVKHPNYNDGRMKMQNAGTDLEAAREAAHQFARELLGRNPRSTPRISEVLLAWHKERARMMKPASRRISMQMIERHLLPYFADKLVTDLTSPALWDFVLHVIDEKGHAPSTAETALTWLRRPMALLWEGELEAFDWDQPNGKAGKNPSRRISQTQVRIRDTYAHRIRNREAWTPDEALICLDVAREHVPDFYSFLWLGLATGMRGGELRALQWDTDVDLQNGILRLTHNFSLEELGSMKTGRRGERLALLPPRCWAMLRSMYQTRRSLFVFAHADGRHWRRQSIDRRMEKVLEHAVPRGVRAGLTFHGTRRCFVSQARLRALPEVWIEQQVWGLGGIKRLYTDLDLSQRPDVSWADFDQAGPGVGHEGQIQGSIKVDG